MLKSFQASDLCVGVFICFFIWFNVCSPESDIRHVCVGVCVLFNICSSESDIRYVWDSGFWYIINDFAILIKSVCISMTVFEYSIRVDNDVFGDVK